MCGMKRETRVRCNASILHPTRRTHKADTPGRDSATRIPSATGIKENAVASASAVVESPAITVVLLSPSSAQPVSGLMTCE